MAESRGLKFKTHSILDDYEVKWNQNLGCGVSGPVRPCKNKATGERYALKCLVDRPRSRTEVNLHLKCSGHENIVLIHDVYANEVQFPKEPAPRARLLLVMELMDGGELFDRISKQKHFTEKQAAHYTRQICRAIERCHSLNVAHRDIKPENLLLKDNSPIALVKLSDFGFAKIDDGNLMTPHFTPYYVAPQVLEAEKRQNYKPGASCLLSRHASPSPYTYDKSCDLWSLGVIIYILLCGYPPFYSEVPNKQITKSMRRRIMGGQYEFPKDDWKGVSEAARDLVKHLLVVDASKRLNIDEVMNHPWLREAPDNILQSPAVMLDRANMEEMKFAHSEQLTVLRMPDQQVRLKPLKHVNNPIMKRRVNNSQSSESDYSERNHLNQVPFGPTGEPPPKRSTTSMSVQKVRDVIAHCLLSKTDPLDSSRMLSELTSEACRHNADNKALFQALSQAGWNGTRYTEPLDRRKLAQSLSEVVKSLAQKVD